MLESLRLKILGLPLSIQVTFLIAVLLSFIFVVFRLVPLKLEYWLLSGILASLSLFLCDLIGELTSRRKSGYESQPIVSKENLMKSLVVTVALGHISLVVVLFLAFFYLWYRFDLI